MKVTSFYYLDYPDSLPADPSYASTRMYVEVGQDTDTTEVFSHTLAFQVYTSQYVEDNFFKNHLPLVGRSILIVPELTDAWMTQFLTTSIDDLDEWGETV